MADHNLPWTIEKSRTALLVIDMQNDFVREGAILETPMARRFIPNMKRIIDACRRESVPVIYTKHILYDGFDVSPLETAYNPRLKRAGMRDTSNRGDIVVELTPREDEIVIYKHRYDAFHNTQLLSVLNTIGGLRQIDTVIVTGTVTNVCCESTARSAFMNDFKVAFPSDANGGWDEESQNATLRTISRVFGRVMTTNELIAEMTGAVPLAKTG